MIGFPYHYPIIANNLSGFSILLIGFAYQRCRILSPVPQIVNQYWRGFAAGSRCNPLESLHYIR